MVETNRCAIAPGDRYLLCTDGLYGDITSDEIAAILSDSPAPQQAAEVLLSLALQRGGHDNATAIVAYLT
jgi:serine/threonine protein phosphatase PrpC